MGLKQIFALFNPADVEAIAKIKLPARRTTAWHFEKTCLFSVRSVYNLALKLRNYESTPSSSCPDGERKLLSNIWRPNVHQKSDFLPGN